MIRSHIERVVLGFQTTASAASMAAGVVFVNPADLRSRGLHDGDQVDLISVRKDGERRAAGFRAVAYPTSRGCVATYFPEASVLVPLDSTAEVSNTPASKSVPVRLEPSSG